MNWQEAVLTFQTTGVNQPFAPRQRVGGASGSGSSYRTLRSLSRT